MSSSNDPITKLGKIGAQKRVNFAVLGAVRNSVSVGVQRGQSANEQKCPNSGTREEATARGSFHRAGHKLKNADGVDSSIMLD